MPLPLAFLVLGAAPSFAANWSRLRAALIFVHSCRLMATTSGRAPTFRCSLMISAAIAENWACTSTGMSSRVVVMMPSGLMISGLFSLRPNSFRTACLSSVISSAATIAASDGTVSWA